MAKKAERDVWAEALQDIAKKHGVEFPIKGELKAEHMPAVYEGLSYPLHPDARQHVSKADNPDRYEMTGYKYQYVVNRLNEVVGLDHWRKQQAVVVDGFENPNPNRKTQHVTFEVTVALGNWREDKVQAGGSSGISAQSCMPFFVAMAEGNHYGGHASMGRPDAYKGGLTDAFKKAAAMLGVGKQAYEQTIDEAFQPTAEEEREAAQERGGKPSAQPETHEPPNDVEQPPASSSNVETMRTAFCAVCKGRTLNRFTILARTYRTVSTKDLTAEELVELTKATTEGIHDTCAGTGKGDKAELVAGIGALMMGYLSDLGTPEESRTGNLLGLEKAFAQAVGKDDYGALTVDELRQQAQGVAERCQELRKVKAVRRDLAKRWLAGMREEAPDASTSELVTALNAAAVTLTGETDIEYEALSLEQLEELDGRMGLGLIHILTGAEKEE